MMSEQLSYEQFEHFGLTITQLHLTPLCIMHHLKVYLLTEQTDRNQPRMTEIDYHRLDQAVAIKLLS